MISSPIKIVPTASMTRKIGRVGRVVVCLSGAWPGYRIHWEPPPTQIAAVADPIAATTSEQLINGQAYIAPSGSFREFWITSETIPNPVEHLELRVIVDPPLPTVQLNARRFDGFQCNVLYSQLVPTIAFPGTVDVYTSNANPGEPDLTSRGSVVPRGWIAGGITAEDPFTARIWQRLDTSPGAYRAELARWAVNAADGDGRYSCSFEVGARSAFSSVGSSIHNGPTLLAWPARGLTLTISSVSAALDDCYVLLACRTGTG